MVKIKCIYITRTLNKYNNFLENENQIDIIRRSSYQTSMSQAEDNDNRVDRVVSSPITNVQLNTACKRGSIDPTYPWKFSDI